MQQTEPSFNLPPMLTFLESTNGYHAVHSLDFDIVSVADSEEEAWRKTRIAVATYVEYGLNNGLKEYIVFNAPKEFWDKITPDVQTRIRESITFADTEKKVLAVHEHVDRSLRTAS